MWRDFSDDVSELTKGNTKLIFLTHITSKYETHNEFRNVVSKLASHIVQKPQTPHPPKKTVFIWRWKLKTK
jgi:hypothetical protein